MQKHRAGESQTIPFRSDRFFCANGLWYFEARGGVQVGPFDNKADMEAELMLYIRQQQMFQCYSPTPAAAVAS